MVLFDQTINSLQNSIQYSNTKNNVISNNISNIDTPGYKAQDVTFKDELGKAMGDSLPAKQTNENHLPFEGNNKNSFNVTDKKNTSYNHNGNNVDIDKEMSELAKNQIYSYGLVDSINGKFNNLQTVIRGGR